MKNLGFFVEFFLTLGLGLVSHRANGASARASSSMGPPKLITFEVKKCAILLIFCNAQLIFAVVKRIWQ